MSEHTGNPSNTDQESGKPQTFPPSSGHSEPEIGSVPLAVGAGAVAAILGAVLWGAISGFTGYEVGYIAWAIGLGVGYTVIAIAKLPSSQLAFTASALAIGGILVGKIFAIHFAGPAAITEEWKKDEELRAGILMQYMYDEEKLSSPEKDEFYQATEEEQLLIQGIAERVKAMTSAEEEAALKLMAKKALSTVSYSDMVKEQLGPMDILWILLAVASAWRLCSEARRA